MLCVTVQPNTFWGASSQGLRPCASLETCSPEKVSPLYRKQTERTVVQSITTDRKFFCGHQWNDIVLE